MEGAEIKLVYKLKRILHVLDCPDQNVSKEQPLQTKQLKSPNCIWKHGAWYEGRVTETPAQDLESWVPVPVYQGPALWIWIRYFHLFWSQLPVCKIEKLEVTAFSERIKILKFKGCLEILLFNHLFYRWVYMKLKSNKEIKALSVRSVNILWLRLASNTAFELRSHLV